MPRPMAAGSEAALPPQEVRILNLQVEPQPDGRRVKIRLELTPFQQDPSLELIIVDEQGGEVSRVFIIETIDDHLLFTMHLRSGTPGTAYQLNARLYYDELGTIDEKNLPFQMDES